MSGPIVAVNPDGPGQNNLPSISAWLPSYDFLVDYRWPTSAEEIQARLAEGPDALIQPELAESWEISEDGKVYTFALRPGVISAFGNEFTAADVVWSVQKTFAAGATGAFILSFIGGLSGPDAVRAIDDYTVEFTTSGQGLGGLLAALGFKSGGSTLTIYDSTEVQAHATDTDPFANDWLNDNTAGFGPYTITSISSGLDEVRMEVRPDYWRETPEISEIVQRGIAESSNRLQLLLAGEVHYAPELTPLELDEVEDSDVASITHIDETTAAFLALTYAPPWGSPEIRQAIARAIPYDDILEAVFRGRAQPLRSVLVPFMVGYTEQFWQYDTDIAAARAVLELVDAPLTLAYADGLPVDEQIAVLVQASLAEAGLEIEIEKQPRGTFDQRKYGKTGELQFFVDVLDTPGIATPEYYFFIYGSKDGFLNFQSYNNPRLEEVIAEVRSSDPSVRDAAILEGQEIFLRDFPVHPIAWTGKDHAVANFIQIPYGHTANAILDWKDFRLV
ncbi:MAG: ABC transporter substrate-binding protein [Actinomycetia bacterium]|nr:ABC transporter substrate-binding protein [Actinomycetes bacterium]